MALRSPDPNQSRREAHPGGACPRAAAPAISATTDPTAGGHPPPGWAPARTGRANSAGPVRSGVVALWPGDLGPARPRS